MITAPGDRRGPLVLALTTAVVVLCTILALASHAESVERLEAREDLGERVEGVAERFVVAWESLGLVALRSAQDISVRVARGDTSRVRPDGSGSRTSNLMTLDVRGRVLWPDTAEVRSLPIPRGPRSTAVYLQGPIGLGQRARMMLAWAPVEHREGANPPDLAPGGAARDSAALQTPEAAWVVAATSLDSLAAMVGLHDLATDGVLYWVRHEGPEGARPVAAATTRDPSDPVAAMHVSLGSRVTVLAEPVTGWTSVGHPLAVVGLALLLATLTGYITYELAKGPQRGAEARKRLRRRLQELQSLLMAESAKRERAEQHLRSGSRADPLTGLPLRPGLVRALNRALKAKRKAPEQPGAAVLVVDVDAGSEVRDSLGDEIGDELVSKSARLLEETIRPGDTLVRLPSGRFAALLAEMRDAQAALDAGRRVVSALDQPLRIRRHRIMPSVTVGVTSAATGMEDAVELIQEAEAALNEARRLGPGRVVLYDQGLRELTAQAVLLRSEMRPALEREDFRLAYQPIVNLQPGHAVLGAEALLRWIHPRDGMIYPNDFIPVAEEDGFIVRLNRWVAREAFSCRTRWLNAGLIDPDFYISLNVSGRELHQPDLCDFYGGIMREFDLPAGVMRLEVTERILTEDVEQAAINLGQLQEMGIPLMLDDFGTGYSSLSYLYKFKFDTMKIDRSFLLRVTESPRELAMLEALIDLAGALEMETVAEGIEDQELVEILRSLGAYAAQGYFFARPELEAESTLFLVRARSAAGDPAFPPARVDELVAGLRGG